MPIYEYTCKECGTLTDVLQKVSDPAPEKCPGCGAAGTLSRVVSRTSFVLKGGGWYSDLYGSAKKDGKSGESSPGSSTTASSSAPAASGSTSSGTSSPSSSSGSSTSTTASSSSAAGGEKK